ncbi:hypothetical protein [Mucilaginibacter rubeus]|uniref:Uncharacterized protein n=1 Tax=Mucilaginibacter rubeus TaxID=2027860 RepID=A0A5C1I3W5_9SPHI|nr:hypothetical protein [Mucilaginibacter rubeus]QEM12635.1 hypothetical protein DEO27_022350 [Mucilaginibacter rubeus]
MKNAKDELQHIILGDESVSRTSKLKKTQSFLRANAESSFKFEKQQQLKSKEATAIIAFAEKENLFYKPEIQDIDFISEGAEQKVYHFDDSHVIKTNAGIFYETWLDYFNSLLIHNYFFPATAYTFLGFKEINGILNSVVMQEFILTSETTDLKTVKGFLSYNGFLNKRNNDYYNDELGLIFEDLHDENVLSDNGILFFIDTVFYITPNFYRHP